MRILWMDMSPMPWKQADGWEYLEQNSVQFVRVSDCADARHFLHQGEYFDIIVVGAEMPEALEFLSEMKRGSVWERTPTILVSGTWKKQDFKNHSVSADAASNYAKLPMPAEGFLDVICSLKGISREALAATAPPKGMAPPPFNPAPTFSAGPSDRSKGIEPIPELSESGGIPLATRPPDDVDPSDLLTQDQPSVPTPSLDGGADSPLAALRAEGALESSAPWRPDKNGSGNRFEEDEITAPRALSPAVPIDEADVQVLRKYLHMREEELSTVLREKQNLLKMHEKLENDIQTFQKKVRELEHIKADKSKAVERLEREGAERERDLVEAKDQAEFEKETLMDRVRFLESELKESKDKYSNLKDRVRRDIRKIQSREKELETRLELIKRDSETLIRERDKQVLDLKRKIDAMEYDLDLIQDRKVQAENNADKYVDKISRVAKTLQVAFGMLEEEEDAEYEDDLEPVIGGAAEDIDDDTESIHIDAEGLAEDEDIGVEKSEPMGATAVEELLKKKAEDLSDEELEDAEAATRVFNVNDADQLLAGEAEGSEDGMNADGDAGNSDEAGFDGLDGMDGGNPDDGMGEAMGG